MSAMDDTTEEVAPAIRDEVRYRMRTVASHYRSCGKHGIHPGDFVDREIEAMLDRFFELLAPSAPPADTTEQAEILNTAESFTGGDPVNDLAILLMRTWGEAEPNSSVSRYPCCHVATFADMARAVVDAGLLAAPAHATKWWRVMGADDCLWAETSSESEARSKMRPGDKLYRLWWSKPTGQWLSADRAGGNGRAEG